MSQWSHLPYLDPTAVISEFYDSGDPNRHRQIPAPSEESTAPVTTTVLQPPSSTVWQTLSTVAPAPAPAPFSTAAAPTAMFPAFIPPIKMPNQKAPTDLATVVQPNLTPIEARPITSTIAAPVPCLPDIATLYKTNPKFRTLLASNASFCSIPTVPRVSKDGKKKLSPRRPRLKIYLNEYFMSYDKLSASEEKRFWRCEHTSTCRARLHTDVTCQTVLSTSGRHNHRPPRPAEVKLFGINKEDMLPDKVYLIGTPPDPTDRRRVRQKERDDLLKSQIQAANANKDKEAQESNAAAKNAVVQVVTAVAESTARREPSSDNDEAVNTNAIVDVALEIADHLRKLSINKPSRYPKTTTEATTHLDMMIAKEYGTGTDEQLFIPVHVPLRDEKSLKEALEKFMGIPCNMFVFSATSRASLMLNASMIGQWENNQLFTLDVTTSPNRWRLKYVGDINQLSD